MIAQSYINNNLVQLNNHFTRCSSPKMSLYYSKMAIIELAGWVEESMDNIILMCCNRTLKEQTNKIVVRKFIKRNYGLQYDFHFRTMLMKVVGLINLEKIEKSIGLVDIDQLRNNLEQLTEARNKVAHTHIKGVTVRINAPSITIASFRIIYSNLKSIENELKRIGC